MKPKGRVATFNDLCVHHCHSVGNASKIKSLGHRPVKVRSGPPVKLPRVGHPVSCYGWASPPFPNLFVAAGAGGRGLWDDGAMSKRSTRIAKRDEFENALKEVEEKIRSRREKNPAADAPAEAEERGGESGEVELPKRK